MILRSSPLRGRAPGVLVAHGLMAGLLLLPSCGRQPASGTAPVVEAGPEDKRKSALLVQRGMRFLADDLQDEAARVLEEARRLDAASVPARLALARAYKLQTRLSASRRVLEEILSLSSIAQGDRTHAQEALVEVLLESGDLHAAQEACRPLLKAENPSAVARRLSGVVAYRNGDLGVAVSELKESARLDPEDAEARAALGLALLQAGDLEAAAGALEEAARLDPDSQAAVSNLAKVYQRMGRPGEAAKVLERYRDIYDLKSVRQKVGPLRARGVEAYDAGRLAEALGSFQEILRLSPRDPQALAQAGSVLLAMQRLGEAQASLEQSVGIQPENDFALTELARVHALRNELPAAIDLLQKAARVNPAAAEPHYFLAGIYLAQGRREDFMKERQAYLHLQAGSPTDSLRPLPPGGPP